MLLWQQNHNLQKIYRNLFRKAIQLKINTIDLLEYLAFKRSQFKVLAVLNTISLDNFFSLKECRDGTSYFVRPSLHPNRVDRNTNEDPAYVLTTYDSLKIYLTLIFFKYSDWWLSKKFWIRWTKYCQANSFWSLILPSKEWSFVSCRICGRTNVIGCMH